MSSFNCPESPSKGESDAWIFAMDVYCGLFLRCLLANVGWIETTKKGQNAKRPLLLDHGWFSGGSFYHFSHEKIATDRQVEFKFIKMSVNDLPVLA